MTKRLEQAGVITIYKELLNSYIDGKLNGVHSMVAEQVAVAWLGGVI